MVGPPSCVKAGWRFLFYLEKEAKSEFSVQGSKGREGCTNAFYYFFTFDAFWYSMSFVRNFSGSRNWRFVIKYRGGYVFY